VYNVAWSAANLAGSSNDLSDQSVKSSITITLADRLDVLSQASVQKLRCMRENSRTLTNYCKLPRVDAALTGHSGNVYHASAKNKSIKPCLKQAQLDDPQFIELCSWCTRQNCQKSTDRNLIQNSGSLRTPATERARGHITYITVFSAKQASLLHAQGGARPWQPTTRGTHSHAVIGEVAYTFMSPTYPPGRASHNYRPEQAKAATTSR